MAPWFFLILFSGTATAAEFTEPLARTLIAKGSAPAVGYVESSVWTQIAGLPLYDSSLTPWMPGPIGEGAEGKFPNLNTSGFSVPQLRTTLEFRTPDTLHYSGFEASNFDIVRAFVPYTRDEEGIHFRLQNTGNAPLSRKFSGDYGNPSASYSCKALPPKHFICSATFTAENEAKAPMPLKPRLEKVFYYALSLIHI